MAPRGGLRLREARSAASRAEPCCASCGRPTCCVCATAAIVQIADAWAHSHKLVRIVDESGEDYLYPRNYFVSIPIPKAARAALRGKVIRKLKVLHTSGSPRQ
jgi:hypothetical protein